MALVRDIGGGSWRRILQILVGKTMPLRCRSGHRITQDSALESLCFSDPASLVLSVGGGACGVESGDGVVMGLSVAFCWCISRKRRNSSNSICCFLAISWRAFSLSNNMSMFAIRLGLVGVASCRFFKMPVLKL